MLKILRNKIQSLSEGQQNFLTAILILINIGIVIFWISFFVSLPKPTQPVITEKPAEEVPESLKPGEIGEISEEEMEERGLLPLNQIVLYTSGKVLEVKEERLVVKGSGTNFSDRQPRELTLIFTDSTFTIEITQNIKHQGLEGLKHLKSGMEILIEGAENIRGKTEFEIRRLYILD